MLDCGPSTVEADCCADALLNFGATISLALSLYFSNPPLVVVELIALDKRA